MARQTLASLRALVQQEVTMLRAEAAGHEHTSKGYTSSCHAEQKAKLLVLAKTKRGIADRLEGHIHADAPTSAPARASAEPTAAAQGVRQAPGPGAGDAGAVRDGQVEDAGAGSADAGAAVQDLRGGGEGEGGTGV
jgi:hypothetical protein